MLDNEDMPTTPRPSFPSEEHQPGTQPGDATSPAALATAAKAPTPSTQEPGEPQEPTVKSIPVLPTASKDASTPGAIDETETPAQLQNESTTSATTVETTSSSENESALPATDNPDHEAEHSPQPEVASPDTTDEQAPEEALPTVTHVQLPEEEALSTITPTQPEAEALSTLAPEQVEEAETSSPTIQVPRMQSEPLAPPARPYVSVEELLELRVASDPQISPNGALIAFTVQQCHAQTNSTSSAIWLASNTAGKNVSPWQISSGEAHDTQPRWSPDGATLAFLSDRTGTTQIYLLPMHGGEARQVSTLAQGVTEYSWHPGGGGLLAHSAWKAIDDQPLQYPQNGPQNAESSIRPPGSLQPQRVYPTNPKMSSGFALGTEVQAGRVYTRLDAEHDGMGHQQGRHQQLWLVALNGRPTRLTAEPVNLVQSCWSPDGTEIVFCANRRKDPDLNPGRAIWVLTLRTGQFRRLTHEDGFAYCPSWSPDGHYIAYIATADSTEAGNYAPWLVQAQGNTAARPATQDAEQLTCQSWIIDELHEEWLQAPRWYPDSRALLVPVQERGQIHLYKLNIQQQTSLCLTSNNGRYLAPQLSQDGTIIAVIRADWFTPGDLWSMNGEGKAPRKLSGINDTFLQSHQLIRPKRISWQSFDGQEIEGWLYMPSLAAGTRAPLIIAPHGGPTLAWGDSYNHEFQVLAGHGYAVLAPNIRGSAGYGEAFSRKTLGDWGGTDFRDLLLGIEHVSKTEAIDGDRLGIGGMSYGGYLTSWAISQTTRFKAAVSRNGISSLTTASLFSDQAPSLLQTMPDATHRQERSPLTFAEQIRTPLLLLHSEEDLTCPFTEAQQLFISLRRRKQLVVLVSYPHSSHLMDWPNVGAPQQRVDRLRRTVDWFERLV